MHNEKNREKSYNLIILILLGLNVIITAIYIIQGKYFVSNVKKDTYKEWNVGFDPDKVEIIENINKSVNNENNKCGEALVRDERITINDTYIDKDESCVYKFTIKNTGIISAKIAEIRPINPKFTICEISTESKMQCGNIIYKLTTDKDGKKYVKPNKTLISVNGEQTVYLTISAVAEEKKNTIQRGASFVIVYDQI